MDDVVVTRPGKSFVLQLRLNYLSYRPCPGPGPRATYDHVIDFAQRR